MDARTLGPAAWRVVDRGFDAAFGAALNPLRHLGAIGLFAFGLLVASGTYVFIAFDTSVEGAYASIERLQHLPWTAGGWLRSVHRYAADLFVLAMGLHLLRELLHGRWRGFRRFSWLTGVPLVVLVFACAIVGFWLNWDSLAAYSAQATAEWIDALGLPAVPLARNFLGADTVSDRLFSLFVFVHLGLPLLMVYLLWFHIQRLTRVAIVPPKPLAWGLVALLVGLAIASPVSVHPPADLGRVQGPLALDWILLFVHPLAAASSPALAWTVVLGTVLGLAALPWLARGRRAAVAVVDPARCTGCRRCFDDCPYAAVTMVAHPQPRVGHLLARVDPDLCAGCGICTGACPSSAPSLRTAGIATGIDLPELPIGAVWRRVREGLALRSGRRPLVVFGCACAAPIDAAEAADVVAVPVACTGMMPPAFVDFALRAGAAGVLVAGCREGGCTYRLGQRWTAQRLAGAREPHLHPRVSGGELALAWTDAADAPALRQAVDDLRRRCARAPSESLAHD